VTLPFELPKVTLDTSDRECAEGWNFCRDIGTAARIAGLWRNGWSRHILVGEPIGQVVERGDKLRAEGLRLVRRASERTIAEHLSAPFGPHAARMGRSQVAWWKAFGSTERDAERIEAGLRAALDARGLGWELRRFEDARAARDAWDAWDAWDARVARDAWDAWDAWVAWDAWAAWAALTVEYAALMGWTNDDPDLLTTGIRDAYAAGLAVAVPTGENELGWAMKP